MQNATGPIILVGLIILGFALFWARHLAYRQRPGAADDAVRLILSIAACVCIVVGISGAVLAGMYVLAPIGIVVVAGVALMLVTRYRTLERRSMLRCLSVAAQKGVPLNEAARAFADERTDELGLRAIRLAESIEAGMPLPQALARSGTRLPVDALLAVRVGYETGTLSESLRRVSRIDGDLEILVRSVTEKTLYLCWVWLMLVAVLSFLMLKIVPVFEKMFREFEIKLPPMTSLLITISQYVADFWYLASPFVFVLLAATCIGALYYVDWLPRGAPIVHRLTRRWDAALILRVLAMAVRFGWPMNKTVWLLARTYPTAPIRGRLSAVGRRIDNGQNWCDALKEVGLLRPADLAVLQAAMRVGNLEWALDEMSDSSIRRLVYRLRLAISLIFPATLFAFGVGIGFVVISLFMPLVSLIHGMS